MEFWKLNYNNYNALLFVAVFTIAGICCILRAIFKKDYKLIRILEGVFYLVGSLLFLVYYLWLSEVQASIISFKFIFVWIVLSDILICVTSFYGNPLFLHGKANIKSIYLKMIYILIGVLFTYATYQDLLIALLGLFSD